MARSRPDRFSHDMDENKPRQRPIGDTDHRHGLLAVDPLKNGPWRDRERILPVSPNNRRFVVSGFPDGEGHGAECRVKEIWGRFLYRNRMNAIEKVRLPKLMSV
jgi:hypothetical protein